MVLCFSGECGAGIGWDAALPHQRRRQRETRGNRWRGVCANTCFSLPTYSLSLLRRCRCLALSWTIAHYPSNRCPSLTCAFFRNTGCEADAGGRLRRLSVVDGDDEAGLGERPAGKHPRDPRCCPGQSTLRLSPTPSFLLVPVLPFSHIGEWDLRCTCISIDIGFSAVSQAYIVGLIQANGDGGPELSPETVETVLDATRPFLKVRSPSLSLHLPSPPPHPALCSRGALTLWCLELKLHCYNADPNPDPDPDPVPDPGGDSDNDGGDGWRW